MMLKLHEWSHEIWSKNVIFKCKNYVPHLLFHVKIVVFRNSIFRHLNEFYYALFLFLFFKDKHYNTMIPTFCIMKKMTFTAFHYLNLSIRCEELDTHINWLYLFLKSTYCEYILEKILSILALIAPSPLTDLFQISYSRYANKHYITGVYIAINDSYR
jgi:hypothetical protein